MTILEFIEARYAEREQAARAAVVPAHEGPDAYKPHPELAEWTYVPGGEVEYLSTPEMQSHPYAETFRVTCDSEGLSPAVDESVGPHIALNDPAYVLEDIAAKRFVLNTLRSYEPDDEWATEPDMGKRKNNAAGAVRRMAAPFASHRDYDPAWAPS